MVLNIWRNFLHRAALHAVMGGKPVGSHPLFSELRSLTAHPGRSAIPRRFSSSSLPPLFVSGRFAVLSSSGRRLASAIGAAR